MSGSEVRLGRVLDRCTDRRCACMVAAPTTRAMPLPEVRHRQGDAADGKDRLTVTPSCPISAKLTVAHSASRDSRARILHRIGLPVINCVCCSVCLCHAFVLFEVLLEDPRSGGAGVPVRKQIDEQDQRYGTDTTGRSDAASTSSRGVPLATRRGDGLGAATSQYSRRHPRSPFSRAAQGRAWQRRPVPH